MLGGDSGGERLVVEARSCAMAPTVPTYSALSRRFYSYTLPPTDDPSPTASSFPARVSIVGAGARASDYVERARRTSSKTLTAHPREACMNAIFLSYKYKVLVSYEYCTFLSCWFVRHSSRIISTFIFYGILYVRGIYYSS